MLATMLAVITRDVRDGAASVNNDAEGARGLANGQACEKVPEAGKKQTLRCRL